MYMKTKQNTPYTYIYHATTREREETPREDSCICATARVTTEIYAYLCELLHTSFIFMFVFEIHLYVCYSFMKFMQMYLNLGELHAYVCEFW